MHQDAYQSIRSKILDGTFSPGESLTEEILSKQLKVSRTPVREALIRLQSDGLVNIIRNKGAFVKEITFKDIVEIFELRILLEGHAAYNCVDFISKEKMKNLRNQLKQMQQDGAGFENISHSGLQLHYLIRDNCGNSRLEHFIATIDSQILWVRSFAYRIPGRVIRSLIEHIDLAEAILDGDRKRAEEGMRNHLRSTLEEVVKIENIFLGMNMHKKSVHKKLK